MYYAMKLLYIGTGSPRFQEFAHFLGWGSPFPMYAKATVLNLPWPDVPGGKLL